MLVTTPIIVSPALSSDGATKETGENMTEEGAKMAGADGRDTETTWVDKGGGAIGLETLAIAAIV